jgi:hypothetical protein
MDFSEEEIMAVFPDGRPLKTDDYWIAAGSPIGKEGILAVAKAPLPDRFDSREEAQQANAKVGQRTGMLICRSLVAKSAAEKGLKSSTKVSKLAGDLASHHQRFIALAMRKATPEQSLWLSSG